VSDALLTGLVTGPITCPPAVAHAIARSLVPEEEPVGPPEWLLRGQHRSFRRLLAALRRYRGALLADPVGSGKTYVALAVAAAINRRATTVCLVPATLAEQWQAVAARLGVQVEIRSHEQASRGRLPATTRGLVIVDECHRFRNPATRRYRHVGPWLVGRPVLLVSATPIVNRLADLHHQLRLGIRDDALTADGVVSLHSAITTGSGLSALSRVVIEEPAAGGPRPMRRPGVSRADPGECAALGELIARIDQLTLSRLPATAALVRGVLRRAAGSSPAALLGALRRYKTLLLSATDARAAGRPLGRFELRRFAGELEEQLVLWSLVGGEEGGLDLEPADLDLLGPLMAESATAAQGQDFKLERLKAILADDRPALIFAAARETVRHLKDRLGGPPVAWCTGQRAGVGSATVPRQVVLDWFRAGNRDPAVGPPPPLHLVATDVAAEGLDLQRAARVIHYDLPWTPMRLEQREGRAVRLGSDHRSVEVVTFFPPPALEAVLHIEEGLSRKARLPALAGLGRAASRNWRWKVELSDRLNGGAAVAGVAVVRGVRHGVLAGFTLHADLDGRRECVAAVAGWTDGDGWSEDPETVARMIEAAAQAAEVRTPGKRETRDALRALTTPIRSHLAIASGRRWAGAEPAAAARRVSARLRSAIGDAARRRDLTTLHRLEKALGFAGGGHTAGEAALIARLADESDRELESWIGRLPPPTPRPGAIDVRITGLILFDE
jgi:superfamily II DNA or RNA helicase